MVDFTRRVGLGRPLTYQEADDNFEFVEEQADLAEGFAQDAQGFAIAAQNAADSAQSIIDDAVEQYEFAVEDNANRIRNLEYGDGPYPSLDLLFTGARMIDPRISFTRASTATYFDEMGILRTAAPDEPRIDYDPVTGECRGLLVEGQATNLLLNSKYAGGGANIGPTSWVFSSQSTGGLCNPVASKFLGDDGIAYEHTGVSQRSFLQQNYVLAAGTTYTFSVLIEKVDIDSGDLRIIWAVNTPTGTTGKISLTADETNGPGRYSITFTTGDEGGATQIRVGLGAITLSTGTVVHSAPQLEIGSIPSSYIKTEASQVTRAADSASIPLSEFQFNSLEGVLVVDASLIYLGSFFGVFAALGSTSNNIGFTHGTSSNRVFARATNNNELSSPDRWKSLVPQEKFSAALSYDPSGGRVSFDGEAVQSFSPPSGGMPSDIEVLGVGNWVGISAVGGKHIHRITYYPRALSDAQLIALTEVA